VFTLISVSVWGKLVLKRTKCCKQLLESPAKVSQRHLSGIPISKVYADLLKMTPRPGRPSTSHTEETVARVREIIRADRRLTIREVAEEVKIAFGTCQKILTEDLRMRRETVKIVPRLLTVEQKDDRVPIFTDLRDLAQNDPNFMSSVITGDECWVYGYDPETKQMSSQ